jgi:peptidoglycan/xylan/chitin deacetylase (PgdA/CDA1 family)
LYLVRPPYLIRKIIPQAIWRISTGEKKVFLTFDDGPVPTITPWILDVLKQENIKATFFCVGDNVNKHPEIYQRIIKEEHAVGNHTYNHLNGWNTDTTNYIKNIEQCSRIVSTNLFRPPYGRIKKSQLALLSKNYSIIMWDVLSGDYDKNTSPEECLKNVITNFRSGSIIVFHDSHKAEKNILYALPAFINFAKEQGFTFEVLK